MGNGPEDSDPMLIVGCLDVFLYLETTDSNVVHGTGAREQGSAKLDSLLLLSHCTGLECMIKSRGVSRAEKTCGAEHLSPRSGKLSGGRPLPSRIHTHFGPQLLSRGTVFPDNSGWV